MVDSLDSSVQAFVLQAVASYNTLTVRLAKGAKTGEIIKQKF